MTYEIQQLQNVDIYRYVLQGVYILGHFLTRGRALVPGGTSRV